jgi:hypothetical protein
MNLHQQALRCNINILNTAASANITNNIESATELKVQIASAASYQSRINNILVSDDKELQNACISLLVLNSCKHSAKRTQIIDFDDFLCKFTAQLEIFQQMLMKIFVLSVEKRIL